MRFKLVLNKIFAFMLTFSIICVVMFKMSLCCITTGSKGIIHELFSLKCLLLQQSKLKKFFKKILMTIKALVSQSFIQM